MQLSTKKALLYYYCYFNIKLLKNNLSTAGRQTGQGCEYLKSGGAVCGVWKKGGLAGAWGGLARTNLGKRWQVQPFFCGNAPFCY